jgi:AcrR family transcriptional regulator
MLPTRPDPESALRVARRRFLRGDRFDITAIADDVRVNRVTLYRWFGTRDHFLVEMMWSLARHTVDSIAGVIDMRGADRVIALVTQFLDVVISNPGMQRWLAEDGEHAMRLLTRHDMPFQPRLIAALEEVLQEETDAGTLTLPIDLHELAFVIVRLIESYTYLDMITGERPDPARIRPVLRLLLGDNLTEPGASATTRD